MRKQNNKTTLDQLHKVRLKIKKEADKKGISYEDFIKFDASQDSDGRGFGSVKSGMGGERSSNSAETSNYPEEIINIMDKYFPKGDKRREAALVLQAVAYIEGKKQKQKNQHDILNQKIERLGYEKAKKDFLELLYSDEIDWGSYIKGTKKIGIVYFDTKNFIKKQIVKRLKDL